MTNPRVAIRRRQAARRLAMQALYAWQINETPIGDLIAHIETDPDYRKIDESYFSELVNKVLQSEEELCSYLASYVDRDIDRLDAIEKAVLWIAVYEFRECPEIPFRVVLNEAIALAKKFGGAESHKMVNSVLDQVSRDLRKLEWSVEQSGS